MLESIVSVVDEGVILAREDGDVIYANAAVGHLLGLPEGDTPKNVRKLGNINLQKSILRAAIDSGEADAAGRPSGRFVRFTEQVRLDNDQRYLEIHSGIVDLKQIPARVRVVLIKDRTHQHRLQSLLGGSDSGIITRDATMLDLLQRLQQIAPSNAFVLLQGESGTGKTRIARMIHGLSDRARRPFIEVNCAAIPETLIESELFGHVRGAFTGATSDRQGRFRAADGGTLFLDEISEIPINLQAKLLRVIQDQSFEMVGSDKPIQVDVRIIAASNRSLRTLVDEERFRADLYYRLAVIPLCIPALRERPGDIALLVEHFLELMRERGYPEEISISPEALRLLMDYPWPGNVRELENAIEHGVVCAFDGVIQPESLPPDIRCSQTSDLYRCTTARDRNDSSEHNERERILMALQTAGGNRSEAARSLGIDRSTLWRKMVRHSIA